MIMRGYRYLKQQSCSSEVSYGLPRTAAATAESAAATTTLATAVSGVACAPARAPAGDSRRTGVESAWTKASETGDAPPTQLRGLPFRFAGLTDNCGRDLVCARSLARVLWFWRDSVSRQKPGIFAVMTGSAVPPLSSKRAVGGAQLGEPMRLTFQGQMRRLGPAI